MPERNIGLRRIRSEDAGYSKIAVQVISNCRGLVPQAPWDRLLGEEFLCWSFARGNAGLTGKGIAAKTVARTIASFQIRMGWNTVSPEIIYISGFYLLNAASERLQSSQSWLREIESGTRRFPSQEQEERAIAKQQAAINLISDFHDEMERALKQYSQDNLQGRVNDNRYWEILQYVLQSAGGVKFSDTPRRRLRILELLKEGNIDSAYELTRF